MYGVGCRVTSALSASLASASLSTSERETPSNAALSRNVALSRLIFAASDLSSSLISTWESAHCSEEKPDVIQKEFQSKTFWQRSLLHSMFFTSNIEEFVQLTSWPESFRLKLFS